MEMVIRIAFLKLSKTYIKFLAKELTWRTYTITKVLPIARIVELID